ncbi:MAG: hypothetical protein CL920_06240 [Deltaproteobacteria bacterium]|nr:hypothetical protein [Deltaproteobacteria bacterium]MBU48279.1 hypothetical protein [Deltaproteobacteria bacterium]
MIAGEGTTTQHTRIVCVDFLWKGVFREEELHYIPTIVMEPSACIQSFFFAQRETPTPCHEANR